MQTATVYRFTKFDVMTDQNNVRPLRATREAIKTLGGVILEETAEQVDSALLDGNGWIRDKS